MKRVLTLVLLISFSATLFAAKIYRRNGSFVEFTKLKDVKAQKIGPVALKKTQDLLLSWELGKNKYLVITEDGAGTLPVYGFNDELIYIADQALFWQGTESIEYMEITYGIKLDEILSSYGLYKFIVQNDAVDVAQKIVEAGDGFAFPNIYRELQYFEAPVVPAEDKYYKEGYQWFLKNTGTGIDVYGKEMTILKNADIRFEDAMSYLKEKIEAGELELDVATKIAIMDSGVDPKHPDLKNKLEAGYNAVEDKEGGDPGEIDPSDPMGTSGYSHGTNCAGISAAEGNTIGTTGVCPWCGIYPNRFMSGGMGGASSAEGYLKSYEKYVADPKIAVINCSFGPMGGMGSVPLMPGEEESHKNFIENGRGGLGGAIVYASGNDGLDINYHTLLSHDFEVERNGETVTSQVVTAGATSAWDTRVAYSNYGKEMKITAPSLSISPLIGMTTSYLVGYGDLDDDYTSRFSGTSAAAPVVTGALGVIFSVNPDLTLEEALKVLYDSADKVNPENGFWDESGFSPKYGYGRVNLLKAVKLAMGKTMCDGVEIEDETDNNIDDNCDGYIDEGFAIDISTVSHSCETATDCVTADLTEEQVACLKEHRYTKYPDGYCVVKNKDFTCPDGTRTAGSSQGDSNCLKDCNSDNPCDREGFYCTEENLGVCEGSCETDEECKEDSYCGDNNRCRRNPSEPGGECEANEDCKYNAMCMGQMPGGFCVKQCQNNEDLYCGDGGAKCAKITIPGAGQKLEICLMGCEQDTDCRSIQGMQMSCHEFLNGRDGVCFMPCQSDADCNHENAVCSAGRCIENVAEGNDDDPTEVEEVVEEDVVIDEDVADEDTVETSVPKTTSKKDSGCSLITI